MRPCDDCVLRGSTVVRDRGNPEAEIIFVGEAPHTTEIMEGKPFVGKSGQVLNSVLSFLKLTRKDIIIANAIKCQLFLKGKQIADPLKRCRPFFVKTMELAKNKKLIVCLGDTAVKQVLKGKALSSSRGRFIWSDEFNCWVFSTYHPAFLVRKGIVGKLIIGSPQSESSGVLKVFNEDIKAIKRFIENGKPPELDVSNYLMASDKYDSGLLPILDEVKFIAFDMEWEIETGRAISISVCGTPGKARVIMFPLTEYTHSWLKRAMENPNIKKIVANRPVDELKLLESSGIEVSGRVFDVFTMCHVIDENQRINLENLANLVGMRNIKDLAKGKRKALGELSQDELVAYSGVDADATLRVFRYARDLLKKDKMVLRYYTNFILPVEDTLKKIHQNGCKIDIAKLRENIEWADRELEVKEKELLDEIPDKIEGERKLTRNALIIDYLFKHRNGLRLRVKKATETGLPSVDEAHLKQHASVPWVSKLLDWKKLRKIQSTYLKPMFDHIHDDGRVYPSILLYRTVTGRTSMVNPPIQQIPQRGEYVNLIREVFVADDGWLMGTRDLAQSEVRIMAWLANEERLLRAIREGVDIHRMTASLVLDKPIDQVTKEDRQKAKSVIFGFLYGMSAESFIDYARDNYGIKYSLQEAEKFREAFFEGYPAIRRYHNWVKRIIGEAGYIYSPLGRRRNLPEVKGGDKTDRGRAERQAINFAIQSFSSDLCLIGMKLFQDEIEKDDLLRDNVKILWMIHDSIFFIAKERVFKRAMRVLKYCLSHKAPVWIKNNFGVAVGYVIESDGKAGKSWASLEDYED